MFKLWLKLPVTSNHFPTCFQSMMYTSTVARATYWLRIISGQCFTTSVAFKKLSNHAFKTHKWYLQTASLGQCVSIKKSEYTNTSMCYIVGHRPCGWRSCSATNLSRRTCLARPEELGLLWRDFSIPVRWCARPLRTGDMWLLVTSLLTSSARMDCSRYLGTEWETGNGMGDLDWIGRLGMEWETWTGMGDWEWNGRLGMRQIQDREV